MTSRCEGLREKESRLSSTKNFMAIDHSLVIFLSRLTKERVVSAWKHDSAYNAKGSCDYNSLTEDSKECHACPARDHYTRINYPQSTAILQERHCRNKDILYCGNIWDGTASFWGMKRNMRRYRRFLTQKEDTKSNPQLKRAEIQSKIASLEGWNLTASRHMTTYLIYFPWCETFRIQEEGYREKRTCTAF